MMRCSSKILASLRAAVRLPIPATSAALATSRALYASTTGCCATFSSAPGKADDKGAAGTRKVVHYSKLGMDGFTDLKFNQAADGFLEHVESVLDALEHAEVEDISCSGGVLTLETARHGTFIINKQAPNVQLWLSSPVSGPHHYDMVVMEQEGGKAEHVQWLCDNDGHNIQGLLEKELSDVLGTEVGFKMD